MSPGRFWSAIVLLVSSVPAGESSRGASEPPVFDPGTLPLRSIPEALWDCFTRCGGIAVEYMYVDDSYRGQGSHYVFDRPQIDEMIWEYQRLMNLPAPWLRMGKEGPAIEALASIDFSSKRVAVFGSTSPRYEALAVSKGAVSVVTFEYNRLTYNHDKMRTIRLNALPQLADELQHSFDIALSLSSFDHDGLGRYGDPIDPDADFRAMDLVSTLLKPEGTLVVSIPVGPDVLVWNLHRVYGPIRLGLLLEGWVEVARFGWHDGIHVRKPKSATQSAEPAFVLKPSPFRPLAHLDL